MKIIKGFFTLLLGIVVLGLAWGFFLDPNWELTVRQQIQSDDKTIFSQLNSLQQWPEWTVWNKTNFPDNIVVHEGSVAGIGAIQRWDDGSMEGVITITDSTENKYVEYHLSMDNDEIVMDGRLTIDPRGAKTLVTWKLWGNSGGNPIGRLMMLAYKPMIEKDLIGGLNNLKAKLENKPTGELTPENDNNHSP